MKNQLLKISFAFFLLASTNVFSQYIDFLDKNIIYMNSTISETRFKIIWLQNGSVWKLSRFSTFVNLSDVFIVLDEIQDNMRGDNSAVAYIHGQEYDIEHVSGEFFFKRGFLHKIINKYKDGSRIMLDDRTEWDIKDDDEKETIAELFIPTHVILDLEKQLLIEPRTQSIINIKLVNE